MPATLRHELARKGIHLASSAVPVAYALGLARPVVLAALGAAGLVAVGVEVTRRRSARARRAFDAAVGPLLRAHERDRWSGATWMCAAYALAVLAFPRRAAVAAMLAVSVGDAAAAVVGRAAGARRARAAAAARSGRRGERAGRRGRGRAGGREDVGRERRVRGRDGARRAARRAAAGGGGARVRPRGRARGAAALAHRRQRARGRGGRRRGVGRRVGGARARVIAGARSRAHHRAHDPARGRPRVRRACGARVAAPPQGARAA
jgi:hypothetical protein